MLALLFAIPGAPSAQELPAGVEISGGEGASCDDAVVIEAPDTASGVRAESLWLERRYPGHQKIRQSLISCDGRMADQLEIRTVEGDLVEIYFDIASFFGKF